MYSELRARLARAAKESVVIRRLRADKIDTAELFIASHLWGGRFATGEEIEATSTEALAAAVTAAITTFPQWGQPEEAPPTRVSAAERLEAANAQLAQQSKRKAEALKAAQKSPAAKREALAKLPADVRLGLANGEKIYGINDEEK